MRKPSGRPSDERRLYERQALLCKAFANPIRLHLLDLLGSRELGATELQGKLGISKANLSQHLSVLRSAGVVETRRDGKRLLATLASPEIKQACNQIRAALKAQGRTRKK